MKGTFTLFRVWNIAVKLHFSWWFVFILIAWSLSTSFFPHFFPGMGLLVYWGMGITAALLLFVSVLLHELSHSLVARVKKIKVESITLFFFGGVAGIETEDLKPAEEFQMALAGPLFSLLLSAFFYLIHAFDGNIILTAISFYLYQLNFILAIFNLVPGYPLDGGRAFRAILHAYFKDLKKATRIAAWGGKFVAGILIVLGLVSFTTALGNGLWFILLGVFLYFLAEMGYEQVVVKEVLSAVPLQSIMKRKFLTVNPSLHFSEFIQRYRSAEEDAFVVKNALFTGILDLRKTEKLSWSTQRHLTLKQVALPLAQLPLLQKKDTAYTAFKAFGDYDIDLLPIQDKGKLMGVVTRSMVNRCLLWDLKYKIPSNDSRRN